MIVKAYNPKSKKPFAEQLANLMESIFMLHHNAKFRAPKPYEFERDLDPDSGVWSENWTCPPPDFIAYWRSHRNCDVNPVSAWNSACFRQEYDEERHDP